MNKSSVIKITLLIGSLAVIIVAAVLYIRYSTIQPSTDDAYVQANITYVSPQVDGNIKALHMTNLQPVEKGQLLLEIDPAQYQYAVNQAQAQWQLQLAEQSADAEAVQVAAAQLAQQQAKQFVAQQKANRILALVKQGLESPELGDEVQGNLEVTNAAVKAGQEQVVQAQQNLLVQQSQVKAAYEALLQAKLNLKHTKIFAPTSGAIANLTARPGSFVTSGQSLFAIVDTHEWWVDANYKETQLARIHPGQPARIVLDMYPDQVFMGKVLYISHGSGSTFSLLPPENATGNWVKVTQRFPVRVLIPGDVLKADYPLRVGASATVRIDTQP